MTDKAFGDDFIGADGMDEIEMFWALWDEDGPPTLEDENLTFKGSDGTTIYLMGRGGDLDKFLPDPDLDAALVQAWDGYSGPMEDGPGVTYV